MNTRGQCVTVRLSRRTAFVNGRVRRQRRGWRIEFHVNLQGGPLLLCKAHKCCFPRLGGWVTCDILSMWSTDSLVSSEKLKKNKIKNWKRQMDFNHPENSLVAVGALLRLVVCSLRIVGPCCQKWSEAGSPRCRRASSLQCEGPQCRVSGAALQNAAYGAQLGKVR